MLSKKLLEELPRDLFEVLAKVKEVFRVSESR